MSYHPDTPDLTRLPCVPSDVSYECDDCLRFKAFAGTERVIDATVVVWPDGKCPMKVAGKIAA